jgi:DnaJ like chaperone protein
MVWTGKLVGAIAGYLAGDVWGAAAGIALGHGADMAWKRWRDNRRGIPERVAGQSTWFEGLFTVMGHVAKADGKVSRREIQVADAVIAELGLNRQQRDSAIVLFRQGKQGAFDFVRLVRRLKAVLPEQSNSHERFLKFQLFIALADGEVSRDQLALIRQLRRRLGIPKSRFEQLGEEAVAELGPLLERHAADTGPDARASQAGTATLDRDLASAYALLKVPHEAQDEDVVRAYRRQLSRQHPDKLAARGATEEEIQEATVRTRSIRLAYERIRESRGIA